VVEVVAPVEGMGNVVVEVVGLKEHGWTVVLVAVAIVAVMLVHGREEGRKEGRKERRD